MEFCHVITVIRLQLFCVKSCFDSLIYAFAENSLSYGGQYFACLNRENKGIFK